MEFMESLKETGKAIEKTFGPAQNKNGDMDILDKLKMEHRQVKELLGRLVESRSSTQRKTLLRQIKAALVPHARAEEKVVYNALIAQKDKDEQVDGQEGYFEHELADTMLANLDKIRNPMSPEFTAGAKVLKEVVEHHIKEEERNVWKDVRESFDDDERLQLNRQFEMAKKKVRV